MTRGFNKREKCGFHLIIDLKTQVYTPLGSSDDLITWNKK